MMASFQPQYQRAEEHHTLADVPRVLSVTEDEEDEKCAIVRFNRSVQVGVLTQNMQRRGILRVPLTILGLRVESQESSDKPNELAVFFDGPVRGQRFYYTDYSFEVKTLDNELILGLSGIVQPPPIL